MNPRLAAATQSAATQSMEHTTREIIELVRPLPRTLLLWRPSPDVWSILDNLAHVVRERFKIRRQVRVHTAHGRFTGYVLLGLPAALALAAHLEAQG